MNEKIHSFCQELEKEFDLIPKARKAKLQVLSHYISTKYQSGETPKLVIICTHNSRRSHIGQLCLAIGVEYFQLPKMETFSGGTEATAFNHRAVAAFQKIGFDIVTKNVNVENPRYQVRWKKGMDSYLAFSKKYDDAPNPGEKFAAIMVCTSADEGCPIVFGCDLRLALPFNDPKAFDDTPLETQKYDERLRQIGREMFYALSEVTFK